MASFETLATAFLPAHVGVVNPYRLSAARGREFRPRRPKRLSGRLTARYREAAADGRKYLPLTYGADVLHGSIHRSPHLPPALDFGLLLAFCAVLFALSLRNIRRKWIT